MPGVWYNRTGFAHDMNRRLLNLLTATSLLLCVTVAVLWVRSYAGVDIIRPPWTPEQVLLVENGSIARACFPAEGQRPDDPDRHRWHWWWERKQPSLIYMLVRAQPVRELLNLPGFRLSDAYFWGRVWELQFWVPFLVTAALPAIRATKHGIARRKSIAGCCPACGYDLRASPEKCPECGSAHSPSPLYSGERAGVRGSSQ